MVELSVTIPAITPAKINKNVCGGPILILAFPRVENWPFVEHPSDYIARAQLVLLRSKTHENDIETLRAKQEEAYAYLSNALDPKALQRWKFAFRLEHALRFFDLVCQGEKNGHIHEAGKDKVYIGHIDWDRLTIVPASTAHDQLCTKIRGMAEGVVVYRETIKEMRGDQT